MNARPLRNRSMSLRLSIGTALLALTSTALGADAPYRGQHDDDNAPLRGPRVERRHAPGADAPFVRGMSDRRTSAPRIPNEVFLKALRSLAADDAPESIRLTDEQVQKLRRLAERHRERAKAFHDKHKQELEHAHQQRSAPNARKQAHRPSPEQRQRMLELREKAPRPEGVHTRMWSVLNEAQREALRERLGQAMRKHRAERQQRRDGAERQRAPQAKERQRHEGQRRKFKVDRGPRAGNAPRADRPDRPERRQRAERRRAPDNDASQRFKSIWSRISQLPPRARMRLLDRLEAGLDRMEADRKRIDKPAPSMDDVDVPSADDS